MGRLAIIDKTVETLLLELSGAWNIGLLIGYVNEQRDHVIHFANTPIDASEKSKGIGTISDILVTSHAAELQRMLPGGLCICGIAAYAPDLTSCYTQLQQIMLATYKKVSQVDKYSYQADNWQLILVDSQSKKMSSRSLYVADYKSSLSPSEVRVQSLNGGWVIAETSLSINENIYLHRNQQDQHFDQQLVSGLSPHFKTITNARTLFNDKIVEESEVFGSASAGKGKKGSQQSLEPSHINVQLLGQSKGEGSSLCAETVSSIWLKGTVSAIAFFRAPATARQISHAIKSDLKKTIYVRCQLLCEDILQVGSEKHTAEEQLIYELPPRVYIAHGSLPIVFNDYMFKDERVEDCAERAQQLLGISHIDSSTIDTTIEHGAKLEDIEHLQKLRSEEPDVPHEPVSTPSLMGGIGRIASIASGAAIALAVSLTYLNLDEWFG